MIANLLALLTALLHGYFWILEMFLWQTPFGRKTFKTSQDTAESSAKLAANQGLYNGLLALGILLSLIVPPSGGGLAIRIYCLGFATIAGCYGWYSLKNIKVFLIQSLPAIAALIASAIYSIY